MKYDELTIDLYSYKVFLSGKRVFVSPKEFELLRYLALNPNQVLTKEQILKEIWGLNSSDNSNTVTVYIRRLREKIEHNPSNPKFIKTVWGIGYKFETSY